MYAEKSLIFIEPGKNLKLKNKVKCSLVHKLEGSDLKILILNFEV